MLKLPPSETETAFRLDNTAMKLFVALPNLHTSAYGSPRKHIRLHLSHAIAGWEDVETLSLVTSKPKKYIICYL